VRGNQIARIASEIVRLAEQQVDLLETVPVGKWTETQQEGYLLRRRQISELAREIEQIDPRAAA
jgi:hypothetical protein